MPSSTSSSVSLPAENIKLEADPLRLSQVIGNLLTNAAKYTDPEGQIALSARIENAELVIAIRDSGIGLTAGSRCPGLFTMFSQVNSAIDRAEGGLGIGLALVKGLVALHGGRVEVRSEGLGRGSEFIVHLPHRVLAPANAAARGRRYRRRERQRRAARPHPGRRRQSRRRRIAGAGAALLGLRSVHRVRRRRSAGDRRSATVRAPPSSTSACPA